MRRPEPCGTSSNGNRRPEQRPHNLVFNAAAEAASVKHWYTELPCLRHEQQHDAADRAGDAADQLWTHIFLP
jgi:hypothetical protein